MSASPKTRCSTLNHTNTRASINPSSPATSLSTTYAPSRSRTLQHVLIHAQWNGFVELLPLWLAPNLVTLLGFFFILGNVLLLELYIPDLVGPVSTHFSEEVGEQQEADCNTGTFVGILQLRVRHVDASRPRESMRSTR
jgi:hypothetical protein